MGAMSKNGDNFICYHCKMFHGGILNYSMYGKELYVLVHAINKWNNYMMGEGTLSTFITSRDNICRPKVSFNYKLDTTSGFGFCSGFI